MGGAFPFSLPISQYVSSEFAKVICSVQSKEPPREISISNSLANVEFGVGTERGEREVDSKF